MVIASFSSSCTSLGRWDRVRVTTITAHRKLQLFEAANHMLAIHHLHLGPQLLGNPAEHLCKQQNNQLSRNNSSHSKKCDDSVVLVSQWYSQDPWLSISNFAPCYSHCLITSLPHVGHLTSTAPCMKAGSVPISRSTSFKMEKTLSRGLWFLFSFIGPIESHNCQGELRQQW